MSEDRRSRYLRYYIHLAAFRARVDAAAVELGVCRERVMEPGTFLMLVDLSEEKRRKERGKDSSPSARRRGRGFGASHGGTD